MKHKSIIPNFRRDQIFAPAKRVTGPLALLLVPQKRRSRSAKVKTADQLKALQEALERVTKERDEARAFLVERAHREDRVEKITIVEIDNRAAFRRKIRVGDPTRITLTSKWVTTAHVLEVDPK